MKRQRLLLTLVIPLLLSSCTPKFNSDQTVDDSQYPPTSYAQNFSDADTESSVDSENSINRTVSCSSVSSGTKNSSDETDDWSDSLGFDYGQEITKLIDDNPIDNDANRMTGNLETDYEIISFYNALIDNWKNEMNYQYNVLLGKLSGSAKQSLVKSQKSWEDYYEADDQMYSEQYYEAFDSIIIKMGSEQSEYRKYKYRTIELMNMIYQIDGSIHFNYKSQYPGK